MTECSYHLNRMKTMRKKVELTNESLALLYNLHNEGVDIAILARASGISEFKLRQMIRRILVNRLRQTKKDKTRPKVPQKTDRKAKKDRQEKERLERRVSELKATVEEQTKIIQEHNET